MPGDGSSAQVKIGWSNRICHFIHVYDVAPSIYIREILFSIVCLSVQISRTIFHTCYKSNVHFAFVYLFLVCRAEYFSVLGQRLNFTSELKTENTTTAKMGKAKRKKIYWINGFLFFFFFSFYFDFVLFLKQKIFIRIFMHRSKECE